MFKFGFLTPGWLLGPSSETSSLIGNMGNILNLSLHISAIDITNTKHRPHRCEPWAVKVGAWIFLRAEIKPRWNANQKPQIYFMLIPAIPLFS